MNANSIRSSLYQCLEQGLDASNLFQLITLDANGKAYSITMYISLSTTDTTVISSTSANMFFEINLTSSSGSTKPNYSIRNANIAFASDTTEIKLYFHNNAVYLELPGQMAVTVRKEIKYGEFANLLSSAQTSGISFTDNAKICSITNMTEDASDGTYLVSSMGPTVYAMHVLPSVNKSDVVSGSNIGTDTGGEGGWYENAYIKNLHVGTATNTGSLTVSGSASATSADFNGTLSVTGADPTNGAAATAKTISVTSTLKSNGDATAANVSVEKTLSVTGADPTNGAAATAKTISVTNTLKSNGDATAKTVVVNGRLTATTTDANEVGVSTDTLTTPSLKATGSVSVTGKGGLNYSGIDSGTTDVDRPVWFASADSAGTVTNGTPVVSDDFKYNPSTKTLTVANLSGNAATATEFSSEATVELTGDVTGSVNSTHGWTVGTTICDGAVTTAKIADSAVTADKLDSIIDTGSAEANGMTVTLSQDSSKGGLKIGLSGDSVDSADTASKVTVATSSDKLYLLGATNTSGDVACYAYDNVYAQNGAMNAYSYNASSDLRLKENVSDYRCGKSILDLPVKRFDFVEGPKNQIGCIAQDLQKICPDIVVENENGYLSIQESKIVYLLLQEVKDQREMINALETKIYALSEKISKQ